MFNGKQSGAKPYLTTRSLQPENQETPISFIGDDLMPQKLFYRRNHFAFPALTHLNYWLPINGLVTSPLILSLHDLMQMPSETVKIVMECSGNKRGFFRPKVFGEQWKKGAMSQGVWKGVALRTILNLAGLRMNAKEVVVEGFDNGKRSDVDQVFHFTRSLPLDKALHPDTMIAYELNGQPIPFKHGYPLRLIVPQWYAMASVKWVKQITVIEEQFSGPFQSIDYMYYPNQEDNKGAYPVTTMNVNSTIQKPLDMDVLNTGTHEIRGLAWSGSGTITKVEISLDGGQTWANTNIETNPQADYSWIAWSYSWNVTEKGEYTILSKATDSSGQSQPKTPFWNRKGYGYNAIDQIRVQIK